MRGATETMLALSLAAINIMTAEAVLAPVSVVLARVAVLAFAVIGLCWAMSGSAA